MTLLALAKAFADRPEVRMVVISEGPGRKWLEANKGDAANLLLRLLELGQGLFKRQRCDIGCGVHGCNLS